MIIKHYKKKCMRGTYKNLIFHNNECLHSGIKAKDCRCDEEVVRERWVKYLGLIIDDKMGWDRQVKNVCDKLRRCLFAVASMKGKAPANLKKLVYQSLGQSHVNYAITSWGKCGKTLRKRVNELQWRIIKKFAPLRNRAKARKTLGLMTIETNYAHQVALQYYWDKDIKRENVERRSERLLKGNKKRNMRRERVRTLYGDKLHNQIIPKIWESLPKEMLKFTTFAQVKNNFKKWWFTKTGKEVLAKIFV